MFFFGKTDLSADHLKGFSALIGGKKKDSVHVDVHVDVHVYRVTNELSTTARLYSIVYFMFLIKC